jgi:hypothetical protein
MAAKEIVVKKYVVRLSRGERSLLETMIRKGPRTPPAEGADLVEGGRLGSRRRGSGNQIIAALTNRRIHDLPGAQAIAGIGLRGRAEPQAAGHAWGSRIFDGEKEAKRIALACSGPPRGRARWTLRLLEGSPRSLVPKDGAKNSMLPVMRTKGWRSAGSRELSTITAQTTPCERVGSPAQQSASTPGASYA